MGDPLSFLPLPLRRSTRPGYQALQRIAAVIAFLPLPALADTVWISSGNGNPVPYSNVRVERVTPDGIYFTTGTGIQTSKPIRQASRIQIDDDPAFSSAEEAYAVGAWPKAVDSYLRAVRATNTAWVRTRSAIRLLDAAKKANRFDAAATGYVSLALSDPATAVTLKPPLPEEGSTYLDTAADEVNHALQDTRLSDDSRQALLGFLLDVQRARKDTKAAGDIAEQLLKLNASNKNDPAAMRALADFKLSAIHTALEQKQYDKALLELQADRALFTEAPQQEDALFCLAEAHYNLALARNDPAALKDAALAYMRVVANFKDTPNTVHVPDALMRTAMIAEKLNDPQTARDLYTQIATQYSDKPPGPQARAAAARLQPK